MIEGLDSATPPTNAQARAAAAAGVRLWNGYLSTAAFAPSIPFPHSAYGLYNCWTQSGFEAARLCGSTPIAYCSGWDSPGALKALAAAWNVRLCLDVESGIRPDGPWVQPWVAAAGSGLYGNAPVHVGRTAAFHVLAAYPTSGDPTGATWNATPKPAEACGWQWVGTHTEFGLGVDRGDYDDWFAGKYGPQPGVLTGGFGTMTDADILAQFASVGNGINLLRQTQAVQSSMLTTQATILAKIAAAGAGAAPDLSAEIAAIAALNAKLDAIKTEEDALLARIQKSGLGS